MEVISHDNWLRASVYLKLLYRLLSLLFSQQFEGQENNLLEYTKNLDQCFPLEFIFQD